MSVFVLENNDFFLSFYDIIFYIIKIAQITFPHENPKEYNLNVNHFCEKIEEKKHKKSFLSHWHCISNEVNGFPCEIITFKTLERQCVESFMNWIFESHCMNLE